MREIKVRALLNLKGQHGFAYWGIGLDMPQGPPVEYIRWETLGEYTGLKDANGKEIYEGDIITAKGQRAMYEIVTLHEGGFEPFAIAGWEDTTCAQSVL